MTTINKSEAIMIRQIHDIDRATEEVIECLTELGIGFGPIEKILFFCKKCKDKYGNKRRNNYYHTLAMSCEKQAGIGLISSKSGKPIWRYSKLWSII